MKGEDKNYIWFEELNSSLKETWSCAYFSTGISTNFQDSDVMHVSKNVGTDRYNESP